MPSTCICIGKMVFGIICLLLDLNQDAVYNILTFGYLIVEITKNAVVLYQNIAYDENIREIFYHFRAIEKIFKNEFNVSISYKTFIRKIIFQFLVNITFFILFVTLFGLQYNQTNSLGTIVNIMIKFTQFLTILLIMNVIFLIELLNYFLKYFNSIVAGEENVMNVVERKTIEMLYQRLGRLKCIHFKFWRICNQINIIFSWSIVLTTLQNIMDFCYVAYAIMTGARLSFDFYRTLCKSFEIEI